MKKRLLGSLLAALFVVGLMAPAAVASVTGVAVLNATGVADVGNSFETPCNKTGGTATGTGLVLEPSTLQPHTWSLASGFTFVGENQDGAGVYTGTFNVCGWMDDPLPEFVEEKLPEQVPPIGASCLTTKGYEGVGQATFVPEDDSLGDPFRIKLYHVGWKVAVGALLVVTGNYQEYADATGPAKKDKHGTLLAVVGANPAPAGSDPLELPCLGGNDATDFQIVGAAVLVNNLVDMDKPGDVYPDLGWKKSCDDKGPNDDCPGHK